MGRNTLSGKRALLRPGPPAPYAPGLAEALVRRLAPCRPHRLLDVGCGPGVLTLELAPLFDEAVGLDPDSGMLAEAARRASALGVRNVQWVQARGEDLPAGLGRFDLVTFGQSFHWMDRARVAAAVRDMLTPDGALVLVADVKTPKPVPAPLPAPPLPPYESIRALVRRWLGPVQRAGQGLLPFGSPGDEEAVLAAAGFAGPERLELPADAPRVRSEDDVVAWVWSLSGSAPHLFGARRGAFEAELRAALRDASPTGIFVEALPDTDVRLWRRAASTSCDPSANHACAVTPTRTIR